MLTPFSWENFENNYRTVIAPLGEEAIRIKFQCINDDCKSWVYPFEIEIPEPNMMAENHRESLVEVYREADCPNCGEHYDISLSNGLGGVSIHIDGLNNSEIYFQRIDEELDSILRTTNYYQLFEQSIDRLIQYINELEEEDLYLNNLFLLSGIASMENYLTTALIKLIEEDQSRYKLALKELNGFNYKGHIDNIFNNNLEEIKSAVLKRIARISFHSTDNIKKYYQSILNVDFDYDLSTLGQIIKKRHDIVHRNGRTMEGDNLKIGQTQLINYLREINNFVDHINQQLQEL